MLVLGRRVLEKVIIVVPPSAEPTKIEVCLTEIRGGRIDPRARLGFTAPDEVKIDREEVFAEKRWCAETFAATQPLLKKA